MAQKLLYWIPRVLTILAILFMGMMSFDVFSGNEPFGKQILGFLVHNIPALILIIVLVVAWKYEIIGGVVFIVISIAMAIFFNSFTGNPVSLIVVIPILITGILFILHQVMSDKI